MQAHSQTLVLPLPRGIAIENKDAAKNRCEADRYHLLNLTHLAAGKNRIEFRAFAGTLNKTKVVGYLMMVLGLAELAMNTKRCADCPCHVA
jgi:hypothetical protein